MATRWLDEQEQRTWRRFAAVLERLPGALDAQLTRDSGLTHFDYLTLAMLSEAPRRTLRMTRLAELTNSSLARLSHVVRRLESRELVARFPCPEDGRATNARLTESGWTTVREASRGHVATVRRLVFDPLSPAEVEQLGVICSRILDGLDPDRTSVGAPGPQQ